MEMRILKLCVALGVLAALVAPAAAIPLPGYLAGVDYIASRNQDNGATYVIDPLTFTETQKDLTMAQFAAAGGVKLGAPGALNGEDTWGIWRLYHIEGGQLAAGNTQVTPIGPIAYDDSTATQATQMAGIFFGGVDQTVRISNITLLGGGNFQFDIRIATSGVKFELWGVNLVDLSLSASNAGVGPVLDKGLVKYPETAGPLRTVANEYPGWLDATSKANGGVLVLDGNSNQFIVSGTISVIGGVEIFNLHTDAWFDIYGAGSGVWDAAWGTTPGLVSLNGTPSDVWFNWTITNSTQGWTAQSQDNGGAAFIIPEPITMLGLFLGVGGLGGYLRRRGRLG